MLAYRETQIQYPLTLLHSERPKLHAILVFLSAIGFKFQEWKVEFTNSIEPDNAAHKEPSHLVLHSLSSRLWILNYGSLDNFADVKFWTLLLCALRDIQQNKMHISSE